MNWLSIAFVIVSVLLIIGVLVQSRSAGMSSAFGGGGAEGFHIRRGSEKVIYRSTAVLGALFIILALANLFIK